MTKLAKIPLLCCAYAAIASCSPSLAAQLVRQDTPPAVPSDSEEKKPPAGKRRVSQEVQITGEQTWADTGIDVQPGEHIVVSATGSLRYADANEGNGPNGIARGFKDLLRILPFNGAGRGALIGRVGDAEITQAFLLGERRDVVAPVAGRLAVGINQTNDETGEGTYTVHIDIDAPDPGSAYHPARLVKSISGVDANIFAKVPRRVADKDNKPGDMVNFLILGSEDATQ